MTSTCLKKRRDVLDLVASFDLGGYEFHGTDALVTCTAKQALGIQSQVRALGPIVALLVQGPKRFRSSP